MPLLLLLVKPLLWLVRKVLKPLVTKYLWAALKPVLGPIWNRTGGPLWRRTIARLPRVERVSMQRGAFVGICTRCDCAADHQIERVQEVLKTPAFLPNIGTAPPRRTTVCAACAHRRPVVEASPRGSVTYRPAGNAAQGAGGAARHR